MAFTIVGNVLTAPVWKRTTNTGALVTRFKVASTSRRLDREKGQWVDGNSFRVRVNCWRRLAEGVASSVMTGDPVVVVGRLYTRDWTDQDNNHRTLYELDAVAVGHDLSRGRGKFARNRPTGATNAIEDGEAESLVRGEAAQTLAPGDAPVRYGEHGLAGDDDPGFATDPVSPAPGYDSFAGEGADRVDAFPTGLDGEDVGNAPVRPAEGHGGGGGSTGGEAGGGDGPSGDGPSGDGPSGDGPSGDGAGGRTGLGRGDDLDGGAADVATPGRGRRGRGRAPVPA